MAIKSNKAQCALCLDIIESTHVHHFIRCKCGEIFIDGGREYIRRGAGDFNNLIDLSEYDKEPDGWPSGRHIADEEC